MTHDLLSRSFTLADVAELPELPTVDYGETRNVIHVDELIKRLRVAPDVFLRFVINTLDEYSQTRDRSPEDAKKELHTLLAAGFIMQNLLEDSYLERYGLVLERLS